jgi:hypothetical protein
MASPDLYLKPGTVDSNDLQKLDLDIRDLEKSSPDYKKASSLSSMLDVPLEKPTEQDSTEMLLEDLADQLNLQMVAFQNSKNKTMRKKLQKRHKNAGDINTKTTKKQKTPEKKDKIKTKSTEIKLKSKKRNSPGEAVKICKRPNPTSKDSERLPVQKKKLAFQTAKRKKNKISHSSPQPTPQPFWQNPVMWFVHLSIFILKVQSIPMSVNPIFMVHVLLIPFLLSLINCATIPPTLQCPRFDRMTKECLEHFDGTPLDPDFDNISKWSSICCGQSPGTIVHTQIQMCESQSHNYPAVVVACLDDEWIEAGKIGLIVSTASGQPAILKTTCEHDTYEPFAHHSTQQMHGYCPKKRTMCKAAKGEQRFCSGGATNDDQCCCKNGFTSSCGKTFGREDMCECKESPCPPGTRRNTTSNPERTCPQDGSRVSLDSTCYIDTELSSTTPQPSFSSTSQPSFSTTPQPPPQTAITTTDPSSTTSEHDHKGFNLRHYFFIAFASLVVLVVLGICGITYTFDRCNNHYFQATTREH